MLGYLRRKIVGTVRGRRAALAYDRELDRLELPPNGDDYNAVVSMLMGGPPTLPTPDGR